MAGPGLDVNAKLTLDSSSFERNMKKSGEAADLAARQAKKAAKEAKDAAAAQAIAAKSTGDAVTQQGLRIVGALKEQSAASKEYAQVVRLVRDGHLQGTDADNAQAVALQKLTAAKLETAAASRTEAKAEHEAVSSRQAASALLRGGGIRAGEQFLTMIPGADALAKLAFPVFGAVQLGKEIFHAGEEMYELEQKGKHAGQELSLAFGEMTTKLRGTNDELELSTSRLQDQIGKLEHHPDNGARTALLEAVVASNKLQEALSGATKQLNELLKEQSVSKFEGLLSGVANTVGVEKEIKEYSRLVERRSQEENAAYRQQLQDAGSNNAKREAVEREHAQRMDAINAGAAQHLRARATDVANDQKRADAAAEAADKSALVGHIFGVHAKAQDLTPTRTAFEDSAEVYDDLQRLGQDQAANTSASKKKDALEGAKSAQAGADKAAAAARKAAEERLKSMEAHVAEWKTLSPVTAKQIYDYWEAQKSAFGVGSQQYNTIVEKQAALAEEGVRKVAAAIAKLREENKRGAEEAAKSAAQVQKVPEFFGRYNARTAFEGADASREAAAQDAKNAAKLEEVGIQEAAGRSITKASAAMALAAIHAKDYGAELDRLKAKRDAYAADFRLTNGPEDQQKKVDELDRQIAQVQANRQVQQLTDNNSVDPQGTSLLVGATESLQEFTRSATDAGAVLKNSFTSALSRTNDSIVAQLTQRHLQGTHNFGNAGADIFRSATGSLLKGAEGSVMKSLGLGSGRAPKGTQADPMWVRMAGMSSSANSTVDGMLKLPGSGLLSNVTSTASAASSAGASGGFAGFLAKAGGFLHNVIPGFAGGGSPQPNSLAWVGEEGPELHYFGSNPGTIIPNHKVGSYVGGGGGTGDTHLHIDARGATDPAQVHAQVQAGIRAAAPGLMAGANAKAADDKRRSISR